jgi:hypothetical protein
VSGPRLPARQITATLAFALAGLVSLLVSPASWSAKAPNALFYVVLVLNTYYSVRFFDDLPPQDRDERLIDAVLAVAYVALAAAIGEPLLFALLSTLLFAAAVAKYALLLRVMHRRVLLRRKMAIDTLGGALCLATLGGTLFADPLVSAWVQAAVFTLANVYFLGIQPMYVDILDPE